MKKEPVRCPSCGQLNTMIGWRAYVAIISTLTIGIGIILLPLSLITLPVGLGLYVYAFFAKKGRMICKKCRYIETV